MRRIFIGLGLMLAPLPAWAASACNPPSGTVEFSGATVLQVEVHNVPGYPVVFYITDQALTSPGCSGLRIVIIEEQTQVIKCRVGQTLRATARWASLDSQSVSFTSDDKDVSCQ